MGMVLDGSVCISKGKQTYNNSLSFPPRRGSFILEFKAYVVFIEHTMMAELEE